MKERYDAISKIMSHVNDPAWRYSYDFRNDKQNEIDQKKAMLHAILFFKHAKDINPDTNFNEIIVKGNNGWPSYEPIQQQLSHISWWINKALAFMNHERCKCVRKIFVKG